MLIPDNLVHPGRQIQPADASAHRLRQGKAASRLDAMNVLEMLNDRLTDEVIGPLARHLGESAAATRVSDKLGH